MHLLRRAKIVATLGPASSDPATIKALITEGVNVFRLNFSHGSFEDHENLFHSLKKISHQCNKSVAVLQDLQGPKLRVGKFLGGSVDLLDGEEVILLLENQIQELKKEKRKIIPYNYSKLAQEIQPKHRILIDDGNLELVVKKIKENQITAQVVFGGKLKDRKGMNFPDTKISIESFTVKDRENLIFGLQHDIDYVALSFVRNAQDIKTVRQFIEDKKSAVSIIAKIEKKEAIENLQEIIEASDAIMVARGDLGVEAGTAVVPTLQKQIISECRKKGIPVITATQMLESMVGSPRPTRAEASDVANAVLDGTDALMLSAETASGKFPVRAVTVMHNIIFETEAHIRFPEFEVNAKHIMVEAIEHAASLLAKWLGAKGIGCTTHTGQAACALAKYRPSVPILAFTDSPEVERKLALVWGVETYPIEKSINFVKLSEQVEAKFTQRNLVKPGDKIVFTAGWPPLHHGTTNLLKVLTIPA